MEAPSERNPQQNAAQAAQHIASAHEILNALQEKIGKHPEIGAAITKLELALNVLTIQTGALL
jgi:hypothetical protein